MERSRLRHREGDGRRRLRVGSAVGWVALAAAGLLTATARAEPVRNGFDLAGASVPAEEILAGGPPRDGIPALDEPRSVAPEQETWDEDVLVLGVALGGEARAYPVPILNWHELVNDRLGGRAILVSWCPLCGTGMVFDREPVPEGGELHFGVSGLLYRSDVLMFDRETESLWSQISSTAISGPSRGRRLVLLRSRLEPLGVWRRRHPDTTVLSRQTGYRRDYDRSPYGKYSVSTQLYVPMEPDPRYHPKMPTLGLRAPSGAARAYPAAELQRAGGEVREEFAGRAVRVSYDEEQQIFDFEAPPPLEAIEAYWFAWAAFHPDTTVFRSPKGSAGKPLRRPTEHESPRGKSIPRVNPSDPGGD